MALFLGHDLLSESRRRLSAPGAGSFRCNSTLAAHDFIITLSRHTDMRGKGYLRKSERVDKFFKQDFAGMGGDTVFGKHEHLFSDNLPMKLLERHHSIEK